jgi:hypothetical protein
VSDKKASSDPNTPKPSMPQLPASAAERESAAKIFIERGRAAETAGDLRQALIHYEDALYYLRSFPELENYLEQLRKKVGERTRQDWEELLKIERELKGEK